MCVLLTASVTTIYLSLALVYSTVRWEDLNARAGHNTLLLLLSWQDSSSWTRAVESAGHVTLLSRRRPRVHWSAVDILPAYRRDCSSSGRSRDRKCSVGGGWTSLVIPFRFCWSSCCYCGGDGSQAVVASVRSVPGSFICLLGVSFTRRTFYFISAGGGSRISPPVIRFCYRNRNDSCCFLDNINCVMSCRN